MNGQISFLDIEPSFEEFLKQQKVAKGQEKIKRNWENAFQKWSDKHGIEGNGYTSYGCCGYGSMCDWCEDNSYGRPCIRALNSMTREKGIGIDYTNRSLEYFEKVWGMLML